MGGLGGTLVVLFIALLAGGIAYLGDRVGHLIGRRRLSLFGLRPRHTSTIFAIGTGMLIALIVTGFALTVSTYVQTAFFRLGALNDEINRLEAEAAALDRHTHEEHVVVNRGDLLSGAVLILRPDQPAADRLRALGAFFDDTLQEANRIYGPTTLGTRSLRPNTAHARDAAVRSKLREVLSRIEPTLLTTPVLVLAIADRNLFVHDPIHFRLQGLADRRIFPAHQTIATLPVSGSNINPRLAMNQLAVITADRATSAGLPPVFATPLLVMDRLQLQALERAMQVQTHGILVARAATDIYPHLGGLPIEFVFESSTAVGHSE